MVDEPRDASAGGDRLGNRLLVVDDEPSIGCLVSKVAEGVGFEVVVTEDPVVFVETAREWHPSVIILDLKIPGTDGIELLRRLAADNCAARIVLTSAAEGTVLEAAQRLGRDRGLNMGRLLPKPISTETLEELLRELKPAPALLAGDLAEGISAGQLFLEYQPKLDCRLRRITGVEALVRWRHPLRGIVRPDQFVALAEESDLIRSLTDWVFVDATKQAAAWNAEGTALAVAVNMSAKDIEDPELPDRLHGHCQSAGIAPNSIILELTETSAMREAVQMMDVLTRLRLKGFRLSIDDFGTGYSSLVQLQRLPFSEIKVDGSFVMQMQQSRSCRIIVELVIELARRLELTSVAEAVEDEATLKSLEEIGCDMAQGYHLSRPIAAEQIAAFVRGYQSGEGRRSAASPGVVPSGSTLTRPSTPAGSRLHRQGR